MEGTKQTKPSKHSRVDIRKNPRGLWQHAQDLRRSGPMGVLELRGEVEETPIPNSEALSSWQTLAKEKLVFSNRLSQDVQKARLHSQHKTNSIVCLDFFLLCQNVSSGHLGI